MTCRKINQKIELKIRKEEEERGKTDKLKKMNDIITSITCISDIRKREREREHETENKKKGDEQRREGLERERKRPKNAEKFAQQELERARESDPRKFILRI